MIHISIPYSIEKNIGQAYNRTMANLQDGDHACFLDGDACFTTPDFGHQLEKIVTANPGVGYFTAVTNRVGCPWQIAPGIDTTSNDLAYHRSFGQRLQAEHGSSCLDVTLFDPPPSGVMLLVAKWLWKAVGPFSDHGILHVDRQYGGRVRDAGHRILLMQGVYLYHFYRNGNPLDYSHLL